MDETRYWNRRFQTAPREVLDRWHLERIRQVIAWAYERSPLHRRLYDQAGVKPADIRTWDDYHHKLPVTDKPQYVEAQTERMPAGLALDSGRYRQHFHTTGTSGQFLQERFTQYEMQKAGSQICYGLWDHGIRPGDSIYLSFDFGMWVGLWTFYWAARTMGLQVISGGGLKATDRVRAILAHRPTVVAGTPTYLLHLAEQGSAARLDVREAGVRLITGGGEPGFSVPVTRDRAQAIWGAEGVMDAYGVSEALCVAVSCRDWGGGVHAVEDSFHSSIVDPASGEPVTDRDRVGEHVITSYAHLSQPFVKYRTHDLIRCDPHPDHGCGWTWGHWPGVVLARTDFMVSIRGVNIYPAAVENLIGTVRGLSNHYELHVSRSGAMDQMVVRVEATDPSIDRAATTQRLETTLREGLGVRVETDVVLPGLLPRYELKTKRVFDHRQSGT